MRILPDESDGPDDHDFASALRAARRGSVHTEWLFTDEVLRALQHVAVEQSEQIVAAARQAWKASKVSAAAVSAACSSGKI